MDLLVSACRPPLGTPVMRCALLSTAVKTLIPTLLLLEKPLIATASRSLNGIPLIKNAK